MLFYCSVFCSEGIGHENDEFMMSKKGIPVLPAPCYMRIAIEKRTEELHENCSLCGNFKNLKEQLMPSI